MTSQLQFAKPNRGFITSSFKFKSLLELCIGSLYWIFLFLVLLGKERHSKVWFSPILEGKIILPPSKELEVSLRKISLDGISKARSFPDVLAVMQWNLHYSCAFYRGVARAFQVYIF